MEVSPGNGVNLSQSKLSEKHWISYGTCEHETHSDLCFGVKQSSVLTGVSSHSVMEKRIWLIIINISY